MSTHDVPRHTDEAEVLDPAEALRVIADQRAKAVADLEFPDQIMYLLWGAIYLLGYLPLALSSGPDPIVALSPTLAVGALFVALAVGIVASIVFSARQGRSIRGESARRGAFYGGAWWLSFLSIWAISYHLGRLGIEGGEFGITLNAVAILTVATLYMAGGAVWLDRTQFVVGACMAVVSGIALVIGPGPYYWIMSLGLGGLLLVAAAFGRLSAGSRRA